MAQVRAHQQRLLAWGIVGLAMILAGVGVGLGIFSTIEPRPKIGLITVPGVTLSRETSNAISQMLTYALDHDDIKGVAVIIDSPGGGVADSEQLFLDMVELRNKKPVVVSAGGIAASGGYMMALGANYIYAKEASLVGSVGVIATGGRTDLPGEDRILSGPFKEPGFPDKSFIEIIELLKESFVEKVVSQRGDKLRLSREDIGDGRVYFGADAFQFGLIDAIGTDQAAIRKAAELAGVEDYQVKDINQATGHDFFQRRFTFQLQQLFSEGPYTQLFYLYLEPDR